MNDPKKMMEEGWKAREDLRFEEAKDLLQKAKGLFQEAGDWFNVTECNNHLVYTDRMVAEQVTLNAIKTAEESLKIATDRSTKKPAVLRALVTIYTSNGQFEMALKYCKEYLSLQTDGLDRADLMSHLALLTCRTGDAKKALEIINDTMGLFDKFADQMPGKEPAASIWLAKALATKAVILFNSGDTAQAKEFAKQSLDLATQKNQKTRIMQANELLKLFD